MIQSSCNMLLSHGNVRVGKQFDLLIYFYKTTRRKTAAPLNNILVKGQVVQNFNTENIDTLRIFGYF